MSGAIFETYVCGELLKTWWHRMRMPDIYYYRDKDGREIDFLLVHDGTLYPLEVEHRPIPTATGRRSSPRCSGFSNRSVMAVSFACIPNCCP